MESAANSSRRPDVKRKLVVVGDGASLLCSPPPAVYGLQGPYFLEFQRWLWEDLLVNCLCGEPFSRGMFHST